jgi:hypothetical protein
MLIAEEREIGGKKGKRGEVYLVCEGVYGVKKTTCSAGGPTGGGEDLERCGCADEATCLLMPDRLPCLVLILACSA